MKKAIAAIVLVEFLSAYPVDVHENGNEISVVKENEEITVNAAHEDAPEKLISFLASSPEEREIIETDYLFTLDITEHAENSNAEIPKTREERLAEQEAKEA